MNNKLYIIRHGERIDESDLIFWENYCKHNICNDHRKYYSRFNDPPLTDVGILQAKDVAVSIKNELSLLSINERNSIKYIYSSKLLRSIQTASEICKLLSLPMIISSNFSKTAEKVSLNPLFEFRSIEDISLYCPGIELIDGDIISESIPYFPIDLSNRNWNHSIENIVSKFNHTIIVAHRETIRNILNKHVKTPYCCYALFNISFIKNENDEYLTSNLIKLNCKDGNLIEENIINDRIFSNVIIFDNIPVPDI